MNTHQHVQIIMGQHTLINMDTRGHVAGVREEYRKSKSRVSVSIHPVLSIFSWQVHTGTSHMTAFEVWNPDLPTHQHTIHQQFNKSTDGKSTHQQITSTDHINIPTNRSTQLNTSNHQHIQQIARRSSEMHMFRGCLWLKRPPAVVIDTQQSRYFGKDWISWKPPKSCPPIIWHPNTDKFSRSSSCMNYVASHQEQSKVVPRTMLTRYGFTVAAKLEILKFLDTHTKRQAYEYFRLDPIKWDTFTRNVRRWLQKRHVLLFKDNQNIRQWHRLAGRSANRNVKDDVDIELSNFNLSSQFS